MSALFTQKDIRRWCGATSFRRGQQYIEERRVLRLTYDPTENLYEAVVRGNQTYHVNIRFDHLDHEVDAVCDCPAYDEYFDYCKHIAAVLFSILTEAPSKRDFFVATTDSVVTFSGSASTSARVANASSNASKETGVNGISHRDRQLTQRFLQLVQSVQLPMVNPALPMPESKQELLVEYICSVNETFGNSPAVSIGLRVGVKRGYKVQKLREFLRKIANHEPHEFTKNFTFQPDKHRLSQTDAEIIGRLQELYEMERMQFGEQYHYNAPNSVRTDKVMLIPPSVFKTLLPLLAKSRVELDSRGQTYKELAATKESLPLRFQLSKQKNKSYVLDLAALTQLVVLKNYGYALLQGQLYELSAQQLELLDGMASMLRYESDKRLHIDPLQIPALMEHIVPELREFAQVDIDKSALKDLVHYPLNAKLYLDTDGSALVIDLLFTYGDVSFRPFSSGVEDALIDKNSKAVVRDRKSEERILSLFRPFQTQVQGDRLVLMDDDAAYQLIYEVLPILQEFTEVFATDAVDRMTEGTKSRPRTSVDVRGNQWLDIRFDMDGIEDSEIQSVLQSISEKKHYHRLRNGAFVQLEDADYQELGQLMNDLGVRPSALKKARVEIPLMQGFHALPGYEQANQIKLGKQVRSLIYDILHPDSLELNKPETLQATLRDYQEFGFQWMKTLAHYGFGGILADDMGLGKTIQSIAFILSELDAIRSTKTPVLIVSPASLIYNWRNELQKFAPDLNAVVVAGTLRERAEAMGQLEEAEVYITSYPLLRMDSEKYQEKVFHTVIVDEAQAIKNHLTQTAQAVRSLQANHRFALTGTPIENSLDDLWSILHFAFPAMFPNHKAFTQLEAVEIARRVRPFILRRLKKDVLKELPDKIETLHQSELTTEQKTLYLAYLEKIQKDTVTELEQQGFQKSRMKILAGLTRLRQICCHPNLFVDNYNGSSGKLEQLLELLEECRESKKRVLIFSQFTSMLAIIRNALEKESVGTFYLDGTTPVRERTELCDRFNTGEHDVFLISLKAGGTGLNLTGADTVILYDLWWNPAVEDQAADRAHRIGQKNVVQVIRMVARGTIEERIYELQQKKRNLIDQVVEQGDAGLTSLTEEELRELLNL